MAPTRLDTEVVELPLKSLVEHPLNPNVMDLDLLQKLAYHIERLGHYQPLIVRGLPDCTYQLVNGVQRGRALELLGYETARCIVWQLSDEETLLALAEQETLAELARLLPEDEVQLSEALELPDLDLDAFVAELEQQVANEAANSDQLFSFMVPAEDAPTVERALEPFLEDLTGKNRRGRALVLLAQQLLSESASEVRP